ncbi:hypothetical protein [Cellulomonas aerilata]|uniref:hypothetical protein n=1 Tax=Cellulomonas aerilata TaxID=515326 RepID=UPI001C9A16EF|nr:hypothetical protein [Cellulomonas aerilata]
MEVVIPSGTGQVGGVLRRAPAQRGEVTLLSRRPRPLEDGVRHVRRAWGGRPGGRRPAADTGEPRPGVPSGSR